MTLKLGTLEADISINTSDLDKAESEVRKTGKSIEGQFSTTSKQVSKSMDTMANNAVVDIKRMDKAANQASRGGMKNMRFAAGQLGFQVQDVAVQLQSGTNAMVVLGQQGSQIASIFGPGGAVIGAIIAIGSAIIGSLIPSLFDSRDATEELEESVKALDRVAKSTGEGGIVILTDRIKELAKTSEAAARTEIMGGIVVGMEAIAAAAAGASESIDDSLGKILDEGFFTSFADEVKDVAESMGITESQAIELRDAVRSMIDQPTLERLTALQEQLDALSVSGASDELMNAANQLRVFTSAGTSAEETVLKLNAILGDLDAGLAETAESTKKHKSSIERMTESLQTALDTYGESSAEIAVYRAKVLGATEAEQEEIRVLAEKIQALKDEATARKEAQKATGKIEQLSRLGETDLEGIARQEEERRVFILEQTQLTADEQSALLETIHNDRLEKERLLNDRLAAIDEAAAKRQRDVILKAERTALSGLSAIADNANAIMIESGREGTAIAKAVFLAQKAIHVASILSATNAAAANASVAPSVGGIAGYLSTRGAILAMGYASAGMVAGLSVGEAFGGGRQFGGQVSPGLIHPVTESGAPELLIQGSKQYLLPGNKGGRVVSGSDMQAGAGGPMKVTINNSSPAVVTAQPISREEVAIMVRGAEDAAVGRVNTSLSTGRGPTSGALKEGFDMQRNLS